MSEFTSNDLLDCLNRTPAAIIFSIQMRLSQLFPDKVVEHTDEDFQIERFCQYHNCPFAHLPQPPVLTDLTLTEQGDYYRANRIVGYKIQWRDKELLVYNLHLKLDALSSRDIQHVWLVGPDAETVYSFFWSVRNDAFAVRKELLCFSDGSFSHNKQLFADIQQTNISSLILPPGVRDQLVTDCLQWRDSQQLYQQYGVPWKRGYIFTGPPGNGKSHAIKALIHLLGLPCLYVKGFTAQYSTEQACVSSLFDRARRITPCVIILEDLDSLITPSNRSYFLNELDGFAANTGILCIASTNYPERLDPSILDRPSRFDRKIHFGLPAENERRDFIKAWNNKMEPSLRLTSKGISKVAKATHEFSFAYLKELCLSSMMAFKRSPKTNKMDQVVLEVLKSLTNLALNSSESNL